jgi:hypothetical protein
VVEFSSVERLNIWDAQSIAKIIVAFKPIITNKVVIASRPKILGSDPT